MRIRLMKYCNVLFRIEVAVVVVVVIVIAVVGIVVVVVVVVAMVWSGLGKWSS